MCDTPAAPSAVISADADLVTLTSTYTVDPSRQRELVTFPQDTTTRGFTTLAGPVPANFHVSLDGARVVSYAQWRSEADFHAMLRRSLPKGMPMPRRLAYASDLRFRAGERRP
jgi:hypothetical protein